MLLLLIRHFDVRVRMRVRVHCWVRTLVVRVKTTAAAAAAADAAADAIAAAPTHSAGTADGNDIGVSLSQHRIHLTLQHVLLL
jgi:hypothetical protein